MLVILGLLAGGILAGQSLIRAAELRAVGSEYARWLTATNAFRDKYMGIPGDITNATLFWGAASNCFSGSGGAAIVTCNGNGDGLLASSYGGTAYNERFTYWQQMADAGLIEGAYTGFNDAAGVNYASLLNSPTSKLNGAMWYAFNNNATLSGSSVWFDGNYTRNMLQLSYGNSVTNRLLKPEEAWNLDTKLDDGMPARGRMMERIWNACTNAANSADLNANYLLSATAVACVPTFDIR